MNRFQLLHGNCLEILRTLPADSVDCCVTSPPYYGVRDYGVRATIWTSADNFCSHEIETLTYRRRSNDNKGNKGTEKQYTSNGTKNRDKPIETGCCVKCGAWYGCFGLEPTPQLYVNHSVMVFREVHRVLKPGATLWLVISDSYASGKGTCFNPGGGAASIEGYANKKSAGQYPLDRGNVKTLRASGLKPKDLIGVPWRVAFALQQDGWFLRSEITWCKTAPMPESVCDRPTSATEKIFLFSKSSRYFYDQDNCRLASLNPEDDARRILERSRVGQKTNSTKHINGIRPRSDKQRGHSRRHAGFNERWDLMSKSQQMANGANLRNFWILGPEPFTEAHFATYPSEIPRRAILLGSSERGCCCKCGAPWIRQNARDAGSRDTGWVATCSHDAGVEPCTVLDPFAGAGTTGKVALDLGRKVILIELNPDYCELTDKRSNRVNLGLPLP